LKEISWRFKVSDEEMEIIPDLFRLLFVAILSDENVKEVLSKTRVRKEILKELVEIYVKMRSQCSIFGKSI
jgi:hypothetical protein